MESFLIIWACLSSSTETNQNNIKLVVLNPYKSFAQALNGVYNIPISQLPQPILEGGHISITIHEEEYLVGLDDCKHNLHGRILWPRGLKPLTTINICLKLSVIWTNLGKLRVISLSKGL